MSETRPPSGKQDTYQQIETIAGSLATDIVKQLYRPGEQVAEFDQRRVFSVCEDVIARFLQAVLADDDPPPAGPTILAYKAGKQAVRNRAEDATGDEPE